VRPELNLLTPEPPQDRERVREYVHTIYQNIGVQLQRLEQIINGRLTFGSYSGGPDNVMGVWVVAGPSPATVGEEFAVQHNLGVVPEGFIVMRPPSAGVMNTSLVSAWTTTHLFLTCTAPGAAAVIFVVPPPTTEL
jgi:hypothetical protein